MKYYTGIGDDGTSTLYGSAKRHPKNDPRFEALGSIDELNSYIGICKSLADESVSLLLERVQEDLFILQAELGSAQKPPAKTLTEEKVQALEAAITEFGMELGEIRTFIIAGGSPLATHLDYARALSRRVERNVVALEQELSAPTKRYLNRLSSLLFVLARYINKKENKAEHGPEYR